MSEYDRDFLRDVVRSRHAQVESLMREVWSYRFANPDDRPGLPRWGSIETTYTDRTSDSEVDRLRDRIEQLERRVRDLEDA